jgi:primosomal protein N' (replication factor Y)
MLAATEGVGAVRVARVIVDIPARELSEPFDYLVPEALDAEASVGVPVLVPFGPQRVVGYIVERVSSSGLTALREIEGVLGEPLFMPWAFSLAQGIAHEYVATLADSMRLFLPPGGTPRVERMYSVSGTRPDKGLGSAVYDAVLEAGELTSGGLRRLGASAQQVAGRLVTAGVLTRRYELRPAAAGPVDDRWVELAASRCFVPRTSATMQRAVLDALRDGPVRVSELNASLGPVDPAVKRLAEEGAVIVTLRRRIRGTPMPLRPAPRHERLSEGQSAALKAIDSAAPGSAVLLHGVTGSGKTEVYLRAIERAVSSGGTAIVLVPEISLTPQTVGRFRSRFGDRVAVLHSRLSAGERFDQWDRARAREASVVVGPRSALFAPVADLRLVVIDEEHESSYKQGSAPRYHARDVARSVCSATGAVLVLGSATPSLETMESCSRGGCTSITMPERVAGGTISPVTVVDMAAE